MEKARKLAKDKKKKELRGGGDQPHEEGGEEENEFEDDEVVEVPTIEPKASPEPKASAGYKTPTRRFRKKGSDDSLQLMRKDSSASLASDATESSPLQPKNLFGTPPSEGMKQATLKRFFSPGDEKMEDFSDREPPLKKSLRMMDTIKALIASGQCQIDGKTVELTEKNANQMKAAIAKDRGGRPRKLTTKRGVAGGLKSNVRLKHQKRLKDEVPISRKHEICVRMQESRDGFATSDEFFAHWSKQFRMKKRVLKQMYAKKALQRGC